LASDFRILRSFEIQDLLLQLLATEPWRSRDIVVSLVGKGPMEEGVRRLSKNLGLEDKVHFAGHIKDIESLWLTHHALILPSRFEGLPLAMVEAMLCGRPVIVTDVAGNTELVTDGVTGFVAEAATLLHLDRALERAWEARGKWQEIGRAAAVAVRQRVPSDPPACFAGALLDLAA
jgi:glycosyltransferase involved in cell wall biosynthesis